jgi:hypothetical protein
MTVVNGLICVAAVVLAVVVLVVLLKAFGSKTSWPRGGGGSVNDPGNGKGQQDES